MSYCKIDDDNLAFFGGSTELIPENFKTDRIGLTVYHNDILCLNIPNLKWSVIWSPQKTQINHLKLK